ncbi:MAG: thioesterase family protein [Clostridiales bacterium]|nr:thioesterase family protein [Clostridiales bacterium]
MLAAGIKGTQELTVSTANSARTVGSGSLDVFATPCMIALMEATSRKSVEPYLEEGCSTVGTLIQVTHDAATPLGMKVRCESELIEVDRRRLVFTVNAYDEKGRIGGGRHERFIVNSAKFQEKADQKAQ